jgi:hypothetical protein
VTSTVYAIVTVDGDLRVGTPEQQAAAVRAIRQIHAEGGLLGKTSWLINEYDFHWIELHPGLLLELADSGESLGVHDHIDTHYVEADYAGALALMGDSKGRLEAFFRRAGRRVPLVGS